MHLDDFGGAAAGAAGGLVRWHQDPQRAESIARKITAAVTSVVCGGGFGYLAQSVIEWQWPNIPHPVAVGLSFVAGLTSGVLSQVAVTIVSEVIGRLKLRMLDRVLPPPGPPNGNTPAAGQQPAGGGAAAQRPNAPPAAGGGGADGGGHVGNH